MKPSEALLGFISLLLLHIGLFSSLRILVGAKGYVAALFFLGVCLCWSCVSERNLVNQDECKNLVNQDE